MLWAVVWASPVPFTLGQEPKRIQNRAIVTTTAPCDATEQLIKAWGLEVADYLARRFTKNIGVILQEEYLKIPEGESLGLKNLDSGKNEQRLELNLLEDQYQDVEALVALEIILFGGLPPRAGAVAIPSLDPPVMVSLGERVLEEHPRAMLAFGQMLVTGAGLDRDVATGYEFMKRSGLVDDLPGEEEFIERYSGELGQ
jgi:hypothetical protein